MAAMASVSCTLLSVLFWGAVGGVQLTALLALGAVGLTCLILMLVLGMTIARNDGDSEDSR
jgi:hypothetical protein